jgi:hypothetical protein
MPSYTSTQLNGTGSLAPNLTKGTTYTFSINNPTNSAYFTLETTRNTQGIYDVNSPKNVSGSFANTFNLVQSDYIASVALVSGSNSFTFVPSTNVVGTSLYMKGTGDITLTIS